MMESIIIGIAFCIALGLIIKFSLGKITSAIDSYKSELLQQLKEADKIHKESKDLLEKYQQELAEITADSDKNLTDINKIAEDLVRQAKIDTDKHTDKRIKMAKKDIDSSIKKAINQFDIQMVNLTSNAIIQQSNAIKEKRSSDTGEIVKDISSITSNIKFH